MVAASGALGLLHLPQQCIHLGRREQPLSADRRTTGHGGQHALSRPVEVMAELRKGTPSIELNPQTGKKPGAGLPSDESTIVVGVWMLEPGEDVIVGKRLREVLGKAA